MKSISEKIRIILYPIGGVLLGMAGLDPEQQQFWLGVAVEVFALAWLIIERFGWLGKRANGSGAALFCLLGALLISCLSSCSTLAKSSGKICYFDPVKGQI